MIFELAMRLRDINVKCINFAKFTFLVLVLLVFIISTIIISTAVKKSSDYAGTIEKASKPYAYIYLSLFFVMLYVNIDLMWQIRKNECYMVEKAMKGEKMLLVTVLVFFELSYFVRFLTDITGAGMKADEQYFKFFMCIDFTYLFEALSFLALLIFHFRNFRPQPRNEFVNRVANLGNHEYESDLDEDAQVISNLLVDTKVTSSQINSEQDAEDDNERFSSFKGR